MSLQQIVYLSRNTLPRAGAALLAEMRDILAVSRRNNTAAGVTGFLMMDPGWNVQILEGEAKAVDATLARIGSDPRHSDVRILRRSAPGRLLFPAWSMGAALNTPDRREALLQHGMDSFADAVGASPDVIVSLAVTLSGGASARVENGLSANLTLHYAKLPKLIELRSESFTLFPCASRFLPCLSFSFSAAALARGRGAMP